MKVSFGICNTHYAVINSSTGNYKTPVSLPGAVSFGVQGGEKELTVASNIGDVPFKKEKGNYSGSLIIASLPLAFLSEIFGIEVDENGVEIDYGTEEVKHFALMYEVWTDEGAYREVWYDCTATKPSYSVKTNESGITVATRQLDIIMRKNAAKELRGYNSPYRARVTDDKAVYGTFFEGVYGV